MKLLLIDNRVRSIEYIINSLEEDVDYIIFDYETENVSSLTSKILIKHYESVGIVQDQDNIPSYTLAKHMGDYDLNDYSTWTTYKELIGWCVSNLGTKYWDLIECNIDETWQPVITSLQTEFNITIRSSSKQLGNTNLGDNWVFDDGTSLIGIYFTSTINDYPHTLGFTSNNIITFVDSTGKPWVRPGSNSGNSTYGNLGLGNYLDYNSLNFYSINLTNVIQVQTSYNIQVFLKSDGTCYSCGSIENNATGHGTLQPNLTIFTPQYSTPTIITFPEVTQPIIKYITTVNYATFFLSTDSKLYVSGSYGSSSTVSATGTFVLQKSLDNVYLVSGQLFTTLVVLTTSKNTIRLYGQNPIDNFANSSATNPTIFTTINSKDIKQLECGCYSNYYVDVDNNLYSYGYNNLGQLGVGDTVNKTVWTKVSGPSNVLLNNVLKVSSGVFTLLIVTLTGELYICGNYPWNFSMIDSTTLFNSNLHTNTPLKCTLGKIVVDVYSIFKVQTNMIDCFFSSTDGTYGMLNSTTTYSNLLKSTDLTALTTSANDPYSIPVTPPVTTPVTNPVTIYSNICFLEGTLVKCDQGLIEIEKINPDLHTISKKKIVAITETYSTEKELAILEKDSLRPNVPNQRTVITLEHKVFYKGKMIESSKISKNRQKYNGELLYNVLMEEHNKMSVNNMIVETLDPANTIGKIFKGIREYRA